MLVRRRKLGMDLIKVWFVVVGVFRVQFNHQRNGRWSR